jgi:hypothetical protein
LVLALLGLGFVAAYHRQAVVLEVESMPRRAYREGYMLPDAQALRLIALGHSEVAADLVWIRALSYFAVHFGLDRDYRWLESYIETIIALDPNFRMIYQWAGVVTMYGGQRIDNAAVEASNRFLLAGHERYPDEWIYPFMLGCNYRFELRPETEEQAAEWRIQGAQYLRRGPARSAELAVLDGERDPRPLRRVRGGDPHRRGGVPHRPCPAHGHAGCRQRPLRDGPRVRGAAARVPRRGGARGAPPARGATRHLGGDAARGAHERRRRTG